MPRCAFAFAMEKGGVGKTTLTVNVAGALAAMGHRVLVIDLDAQRNATAVLLGDRDERPGNILDVILQELPMGEVMVPVAYCERLFVVPSTRALATIEKKIDQAKWEALVAEAPASIRPLYPSDVDYIVIDTPPSLGLWMQVGLAVADGVALVAQPEFLSTEAIPDVLQTVAAVQTNVNPDLVLAGLIVNQVKGHTVEHVSYLTGYRQQLGTLVLEPPIPDRIGIAAAQSLRRPIEFLSHSEAPEIRALFRQLATTIVERISAPAGAFLPSSATSGSPAADTMSPAVHDDAA